MPIAVGAARNCNQARRSSSGVAVQTPIVPSWHRCRTAPVQQSRSRREPVPSKPRLHCAKAPARWHGRSPAPLAARCILKVHQVECSPSVFPRGALGSWRRRRRRWPAAGQEAAQTGDSRSALVVPEVFTAAQPLSSSSSAGTRDHASANSSPAPGCHGFRV